MRVFISYSSKDLREALQLKELVESVGHDAWMDLFDIQPAARLAAALKDGVTSAETLCILLSPTAVASPWVNDEIAHAQVAEQQGLRILPIILRPTRIPDALADTVAIDATRGLGNEVVAERLRRYFSRGELEGVLLDAIHRADLADRAARDEAEQAFPALQEDLQRAMEQPLRRLRLEIDQDSWPRESGAVLELVIQLDKYLGAARVFLAPYVEGHTWRQGSGLDERPPSEFFGAEKARVDARFLWSGRTLTLPMSKDHTDLGELPLQFHIELDGSEIQGEERAATMLLAERFELPSLRRLIERGSRIDVWVHVDGSPPSRLEPEVTDLGLTLWAHVEDAPVPEVRLWTSRHEREDRILFDTPTLRSCASDLEREVLLAAYRPKALGRKQGRDERRRRITSAVEKQEELAPEDRWAAFHLLRGRAFLARGKGQERAASELLNQAISRVIEGFDPRTSGYGAFFKLWSAAMLEARIIAREKGSDEALVHFTDLAISLSRSMARVHPKEPDFRRALAQSLLLGARLKHERLGTPDEAALQEAVATMEALVTEEPLPWRVQEAQETRTEATGLLEQWGRDAIRAEAPAPWVFARWLDPKAAARETPLLLINRLLRYVARVSERVSLGPATLHLKDDEFLELRQSPTPGDWFAVGCAEASDVDGTPMDEHRLLASPPLSLISGGRWRVRTWEETPQTGDLTTRLELKRVRAWRALLCPEEGPECFRMYLLLATNGILRWRVSLGFRSRGDTWEDEVADDATAAVTFGRLHLG